MKAFKFGRDTWDPSHRFETSWLLSPYVLFALRALFSLYTFTTLFVTIGYQCTHPSPTSRFACEASGNSFSFFTSLTYWGIAFYFLFAAVHTFSYARWGAAVLDRWPRPLQALHSLLYSTITTFPFLVTVVYWGLLYGPSWFTTEYAAWSNISQHAMNSFFPLFEIIIPRTQPQPWVHTLFLIIVLAMYLGLAYITKATKGFYPYEFLNPTKQGKLLAAYIVGIAAAVVIIFAIVWGLTWVRRWLTERKMGFQGKYGSHSDSTSSSYRRGGDEMTTMSSSRGTNKGVDPL